MSSPFLSHTTFGIIFSLLFSVLIPVQTAVAPAEAGWAEAEGGQICARNRRLDGALRTGTFCRYLPDNMKTRGSYPVATYAFMLAYKTWGTRTGRKTNIFCSSFLFIVSSVVYPFVCAVYKCEDRLKRLRIVKPQERVCFSSSKCLATKQFPLLLFASLACVLTFLFWTPS